MFPYLHDSFHVYIVKQQYIIDEIAGILLADLISRYLFRKLLKS